jgi:hypothetical protein
MGKKTQHHLVEPRQSKWNTIESFLLRSIDFVQAEPVGTKITPLPTIRIVANLPSQPTFPIRSSHVLDEDSKLTHFEALALPPSLCSN